MKLSTTDDAEDHRVSEARRSTSASTVSSVAAFFSVAARSPVIAPRLIAGDPCVH